MSRYLSAAEESRLSSLDRVLDSTEPGSTLAGELFAVVDLLESNVALRRTFTDPGAEAPRRQALVRRLLENQVSADALRITEEAAALRWGGGRSLTAALERQGVRAELRAAMHQGQLDNVEDELFRFSRTVAADPQLADALSDRSIELSRRVELVERLLNGRVHEATLVLARRAVGAREKTFAITLESYLTLAAEMRNRGVATVRVARPLDAEQQQRLRAALSAQVGREIELQVIVDPEVLGGVRVELGDEVIEGTVAGRLNDARRRLG